MTKADLASPTRETCRYRPGLRTGGWGTSGEGRPRTVSRRAYGAQLKSSVRPRRDLRRAQKKPFTHARDNNPGAMAWDVGPLKHELELMREFCASAQTECPRGRGTSRRCPVEPGRALCRAGPREFLVRARYAGRQPAGGLAAAPSARIRGLYSRSSQSRSRWSASGQRWSRTSLASERWAQLNRTVKAR